MRKEVFSKEKIEVTERIRFVTDLRFLSRDVMDKYKGHFYVDATRAEMFLKHTRKIRATPDEIQQNEIKENYKSLSDQAGEVFGRKKYSKDHLDQQISSLQN